MGRLSCRSEAPSSEICSLSVAFYIDEHVNRAITTGLRLRGIDVLTVQEDQRSGAQDPQLLDRASELGRALFTQDDDFLAEAKRRQASGQPFTGVIFARQLGATIGECISDLEIIAKAGRASDLIGTVVFLPL